MRNQPLPDVEALLAPVVCAVAAGPADTAELTQRVATHVGIDTTSAQTKQAIHSRAKRALRCLRMAGLITMSAKRPPQLTMKGQQAVKERRRIDFAYLRESENFRKFEAGLRAEARTGHERALGQLPTEERRRIVDKYTDKSIYATRVTGVVRGGAPGLGKQSK